MSTIQDPLVHGEQESEELSCIPPSNGTSPVPRENANDTLIAATVEVTNLQHFYKHPLMRLSVFAVLMVAVLASATVYWNNNYRRALGITESTVFEGKMQPATEVKVAALEPGVISSLNVHIGDAVRVGDPILKLDSQEAELAVSRAEIAYDSAQRDLTTLRGELARTEAEVSALSREASLIPSRQVRDSVQHAEAVYEQSLTDYRRNQELYKNGIIAQQILDNSSTALRIAKDDLENAQTGDSVDGHLQSLHARRSELLAEISDREQTQQLREAKLALQTASLHLANTEIRASSSGIISVVSVKIGEQISPGTPLVVISRMDRITVNVPVSAGMIASLHRFQQAQIVLPTMPPQRVLGTIRAISPIPDANMTHNVEVEFENPTGELLAGQPAEVRFVFE